MISGFEIDRYYCKILLQKSLGNLLVDDSMNLNKAGLQNK